LSNDGVVSSRPRVREDRGSRGDREVVAAILRDLQANPKSAAREVRSRLERNGLVLTKSEVNSHLYRELGTGGVVHDGKTPPLWSVKQQDEPSDATDADWIMDFFLDVTGQAWSMPQRSAAGEGARVQILRAFSQSELSEAASRLTAESLSWELWYETVVAVRSESFKL
jgi:hypothetical protein